MSFISEKVGNAKVLDMMKAYDTLENGLEDMKGEIEHQVIGFAISAGTMSLGGFIGSFFFPPLGTIVGALIGSGIGAIINYIRDKTQVNERRKKIAYNFTNRKRIDQETHQQFNDLFNETRKGLTVTLEKQGEKGIREGDIWYENLGSYV